ncbi:MAG: MmgE/PrpD family protein [Fimbriimonadales bacterium]|jgi:2-methylcitrate dehydratase|nr:MmgE/PrpD family protein [Fimbriimonadales bacterium]CUU11443.1 2-methylcitrate dehydratase [Armatimonadetes bacterium GBS]CUU35234.1 2-methylcitrate dehydratase [Armatimonadetes bacterium GXS]
MLLAERLAHYATNLQYEQLPAEAVHEAKRRIIDSIACAFGAWRSETAELVRRVATQVSSPYGATIIGTRHKASPDWAAFANGLLIRYLDYNDTYLSKEPAHPSDNLAAVLAVAEAEGSSGKEVLLATVLAYEIQCRLCDAASLRARGWDHVNYGLFSASAAASRLMGLSAEATKHAMSIAGVSGLAMRQTRVGELSAWKGCAFANAARHATFASWLAKYGMTGPSEIFEGKMGFMKQVSGEFTLGALGGEEGRGFMINETYIKYYPVEYHAQSAVWAALALREQIGGDLSQIEAVEIDTFEACYSIIGSEPEKWEPKSRETADHSLPYIVGVTLMDGKVDLSSFDEARYTDPNLLAFLKKITVRHDPSMDARYPEGIPNRITLRLKDGRTLTEENTFPRGHARNPMSDEEVEAKFYVLTEWALPRERQDAVLQFLWSLDSQANLQPLMELLAV